MLVVDFVDGFDIANERRMVMIVPLEVKVLLVLIAFADFVPISVCFDPSDTIL